jgi:putative transcriptional regulator
VTSHLRAFRGERGLTQEGLAELAGVSRQTINSIETGRLSLALILARLFETPVEHIFALPG